MNDKYYAISNTNEFKLTEGKEYILEDIGLGSVYVYGINGDYLTYCRKDSFSNWRLIGK